VSVLEQSEANLQARGLVPGNSDRAITIAREIIHDYLVASFGEPSHVAVSQM
jgi:hypothetical protein